MKKIYNTASEREMPAFEEGEESRGGGSGGGGKGPGQSKGADYTGTLTEWTSESVRKPYQISFFCRHLDGCI
jgi:hypothetical protein